MKSKAITLLLIVALMGFSEKPLQKEYSYLLTVTSISMNDEERRFNLEIFSEENSSEPFKMILENQRVPFELKLNPGRHTIIVSHIGEKGHINSRVMGILNGKSMGSASTDSSGTVLKVGPGGHYSTVR